MKLINNDVISFEFNYITRLAWCALARLAYDKTILHMLEKLPLFRGSQIKRMYIISIMKSFVL